MAYFVFYPYSRLTNVNSMDSVMGSNAVVGNVEKKWEIPTNLITLWSKVARRVVGAEVCTFL